MLTLKQKNNIKDLLLQQKTDFEMMEERHTLAGERLFAAAEDRCNNFDERNSDAAMDADLHLENHYLAILSKINRCLSRLDDDNFGLCIDCQEPIAYRRLLAFPMAERCVSCKTEYEKSHSE